MSEKTELTAMTVSVPESLKAWVKAHAAAAGCATPSDFVRRLLYQAKKGGRDRIVISPGVDPKKSSGSTT